MHAVVASHGERVCGTSAPRNTSPNLQPGTAEVSEAPGHRGWQCVSQGLAGGTREAVLSWETLKEAFLFPETLKPCSFLRLVWKGRTRV